MRGDFTIEIDVVDSEGRILAHVNGSVTGDVPEVEVTFRRTPKEIIEKHYDRIHSTESYVHKILQDWLEHSINILN